MAAPNALPMSSAEGAAHPCAWNEALPLVETLEPEPVELVPAAAGSWLAPVLPVVLELFEPPPLHRRQHHHDHAAHREPSSPRPHGLGIYTLRTVRTTTSAAACPWRHESPSQRHRTAPQARLDAGRLRMRRQASGGDTTRRLSHLPSEMQRQAYSAIGIGCSDVRRCCTQPIGIAAGCRSLTSASSLVGHPPDIAPRPRPLMAGPHQ